MSDQAYSDLELSAIQEIGNIGTGSAATALSQLVGRQIDIDVPQLELVSLADAAEQIGPLESEVMGVLTPIMRDFAAGLLLVFPVASAEILCGMLGVDAHTEMGHSCLQEIGNILTGSYGGALAQMTGLDIEPAPPMFAADMLGAVVDSVLAMSATSEKVLFMKTALHIEGNHCDFGFLFVPQEGAVGTMLAALGMA
jgi:chemotaxis protein CheC